MKTTTPLRDSIALGSDSKYPMIGCLEIKVSPSQIFYIRYCTYTLFLPLCTKLEFWWIFKEQIWYYTCNSVSIFFFLFVLCFYSCYYPFFTFTIRESSTIWTKYLEQSKEIKQNWATTKVFDTYFCAIFDCYCRNFISGGKAGC